MFNTLPLFTTLNHTQYGTYTGSTQSCDLGGRTGYLAGSDHNLSFVSGGVLYNGCYSLNFAPGVNPAGGAKRPAVFAFASGLPRPATVSADASRLGDVPLGIPHQAKQNGWDMVYMGLFSFSDPSNPYGFSYDQVYVDYTRAVIADLEANNNTDPSRIYAFGSSAGARVPSFMACHLSDQFAAVVSAGGAVHGPGISSSLAVDRCGQPTHPVSAMYVYADQAQVPDGNPLEHYSVHITPTHTSLTPSDITDITTGSPSQVYYSMQHVGETWAYWNGCANNLVGRSVQTVTVGQGTTATPNSQLWQWNGCRDEHGGTTGAVDLYVMPGSHGIETETQDDGSAYRFLASHPG